MEQLIENLPSTTNVIKSDSCEELSFLQPLPDIPSSFFSRKFNLEYPNVAITSLDITSHGCFVVAGCSNGMVLLFDLTSADSHGILAGHIRAKGMHTNLLLTVKITEDCRFAFAGVMKGSMEMIAIDMGRIPLWRHNTPLPTTGLNGIRNVNEGLPKRRVVANGHLRPSSVAPNMIKAYSHLDPKLRGFGAACKSLKSLGNTSTISSSNSSSYLLGCGRGIKNVHVWAFNVPDIDEDDMGNKIQPQWIWLYDVATNGNTIETIGFRVNAANGTHQMLSKSLDMCVRVWDLTSITTSESTSSTILPESTSADTSNRDDASSPTPLPKVKFTCEDVSNSNDTSCFCGEGTVAFGGKYDFAVVSLQNWDEKQTGRLSREVYEVPARCSEDDNGLRRRRLMRQIDEVIGSQDGMHVLALCTDGGVLYYHSTTPYTYTLGMSSSSANLQETESFESAVSKENNVSNMSEKCASRKSDQNEDENIGDNQMSVDVTTYVQSGSLVELTKLSREIDPVTGSVMDGAWNLRRVGRSGHVVLLRSCRPYDSSFDESDTFCIDISLLSDVEYDAVLPTELARGQIWSSSDCYHDPVYSKTIMLEEDMSAQISRNLDSIQFITTTSSSIGNRGRPPTGKKSLIKPTTQRSVSDSQLSDKMSLGSMSPKVDATKQRYAISSGTPNANVASKTVGYSTPSGEFEIPHASTRKDVLNISPADMTISVLSSPASTTDLKEQHAQQSRVKRVKIAPSQPRNVQLHASSPASQLHHTPGRKRKELVEDEYAHSPEYEDRIACGGKESGRSGHNTVHTTISFADIVAQNEVSGTTPTPPRVIRVPQKLLTLHPVLHASSSDKSLVVSQAVLKSKPVNPMMMKYLELKHLWLDSFGYLTPTTTVALSGTCNAESVSSSFKKFNFNSLSPQSRDLVMGCLTEQNRLRLQYVEEVGGLLQHAVERAIEAFNNKTCVGDGVVRSSKENDISSAVVSTFNNYSIDNVYRLNHQCQERVAEVVDRQRMELKVSLSMDDVLEGNVDSPNTFAENRNKISEIVRMWQFEHRDVFTSSSRYIEYTRLELMKWLPHGY